MEVFGSKMVQGISREEGDPYKTSQQEEEKLSVETGTKTPPSPAYGRMPNNVGLKPRYLPSNELRSLSVFRAGSLQLLYGYPIVSSSDCLPPDFPCYRALPCSPHLSQE